MIGFRWTAVALLGAVTLTGCSGDEAGPMRLAGYGAQSAPQPASAGAAYFGIDACAEGENVVEVKVLDVRADSTTGTNEPIGFSVAWPGSLPTDRVGSGHGDVPDGYQPVEGSTGLLESCGGDPDQQASFLVQFPPTQKTPIKVTGVVVVYEVDGDRYTAHAAVDLTQLP